MSEMDTTKMNSENKGDRAEAIFAAALELPKEEKAAHPHL